ncbi:MAG: tetratricopeptide repeat protein [Candidatus Sulfotelmatobacter sp.]|jgi:tetratricopeptide (TPR) repeat protein
MKPPSLILPLVFFLILEPMFAAEPAKQLLDSGRVDEAIQTLEQKLKLTPTDAESHNLLCRAYFMLDEWDRAISACEHAVNLAPQQSSYHLWLGRAYGEKADRAGVFSAAGLAKKVRMSFERAVELDPKSSEARTDLGEFYTEAPSIVGGGKDKARAQADALMTFDPTRGHWLLARIEEKNKDIAAAEREYRAAIAASHSGARGWLDLANFFFYGHRTEEMEDAIHTLESSPVDHPEALMHGAGILLRAGRDYPTAIRLLRRYLTAPVEDGPAFKAHDQLGQLLEKQGDRHGAAEEFRAALALAHNYARAQEDLKQVEH